MNRNLGQICLRMQVKKDKSKQIHFPFNRFFWYSRKGVDRFFLHIFLRAGKKSKGHVFKFEKYVKGLNMYRLWFKVNNLGGY